MQRACGRTKTRRHHREHTKHGKNVAGSRFSPQLNPVWLFAWRCKFGFLTVCSHPKTSSLVFVRLCLCEIKHADCEPMMVKHLSAFVLSCCCFRFRPVDNDTKRFVAVGIVRSILFQPFHPSSFDSFHPVQPSISISLSVCLLTASRCNVNHDDRHIDGHGGVVRIPETHCC